MKTTEKIADAIRAGYDSVLIRERYEADLLEEVMGLPEYQDPTPDTPNVSGYEIREAGMLLEILAESELHANYQIESAAGWNVLSVGPVDERKERRRCRLHRRGESQYGLLHIWR